jgi:hypothetical protein
VSKRKRKAHPAAKPRRRPAKRSPSRSRRRAEPDLIEMVAEALAGDEPLPLLALASSLLAAVDPRARGPFDQPGPDEPSLDEMVDSLVAAPLPESSALLTALAVLSADEVLRKRVAREVADRAHSLPGWLVELHRAEPGDEAVEVADPLGDGAQVLLEVTLLGGHAITAIVGIDHNTGGTVGDAMVMPVGMDVALDEVLTSWGDPDVTGVPLAPADARTRVESGIRFGARLFPPVETESWPSSRPLVEWMARMLPAGGRDYEPQRWEDDAVHELARRFRASPEATGVADPGDVLSWILTYGAGAGLGDPRLWSPERAEILLLDWIPRKVVAEVDDLAPAPDVLRALVRFCGAELGLRPDLTERTLAAIDEFAPEYQELIRSERPQGAAALLAAMGLDGPDPADAEDLDET